MHLALFPTASMHISQSLANRARQLCNDFVAECEIINCGIEVLMNFYGFVGNPVGIDNASEFPLGFVVDCFSKHYQAPPKVAPHLSPSLSTFAKFTRSVT